MPRPTTKSELIKLSNENYQKLIDLIGSLTKQEQEKEFLFDDRDKNVKDVLVHLYEWHQLLIRWISVNKRGEEASFLPVPYNWKTYPKMNIELWEKHRETSLDEAFDLLSHSHADALATIGLFTDEELFTKKHFSWTGTTSLGSYCVSATASHYEWAIKKIKKHIKSMK